MKGCFQETPIDPHERQQQKRQPSKWVVLLALLPWLFLVGGGISMCVLYAPGEKIGTVGYCILAIMVTPLLAAGVLAIMLSWRRRYLDLDCTWCGRPFYTCDLPEILRTRLCPACGQTVPVEDLEDLE